MIVPFGRAAKRAKKGYLPVVPTDGSDDPNVDWNWEVGQAMLTITGCKVFGEKIVSEEALNQKDGFLAPWAPDLFHNMPESKIVGPCGVNALWCSPTFSVAPGVPTNKAGVKRLQQVYFPNNEPRPFQGIIDFVYPGKCKQLPVSLLRRISPEEPVQALVITIAERIRAGATESELKEWRRVILSAPGRFVVAESNDAQYFNLQNSRGLKREEQLAMGQTPSRIVIDTWLFKLRKEKDEGPMNAAKLGKLYRANLIEGGDNAESRRKDSNIDICLQIYPVFFFFFSKSWHSGPSAHDGRQIQR